MLKILIKGVTPVFKLRYKEDNEEKSTYALSSIDPASSIHSNVDPASVPGEYQRKTKKKCTNQSTVTICASLEGTNESLDR